MTEDVVAIQQLLHRYCFAEDSGTPDETVFLTSKVPQGASGGMNYPTVGQILPTEDPLLKLNFLGATVPERSEAVAIPRCRGVISGTAAHQNRVR
jgi:hypothetical protein